MKILGIDPGSAICGWGVVEKNPRTNQLKLVECGCIRTTNRHSTAERLKVVYDGIQEVINRYKPDEVAVEELFFVQNVKTGIVVGQARGVLLLTAALAGKPVFEYKPTQIKMALVGYGRADKKQVQNMVKLVLKMDKPIAQDDTADAVAVAICHIQHSNAREYSHANHANKTRISLECKQDAVLSKPEILYPDLSYRIVGVLQRVSNEYGYKVHERYYYSLIEQCLREKNIPFQKQVPIKLGLPFPRRYFLDYIIDDKIILEIKVGSRVCKLDVDQTMAYLRETQKKLAILARFNRSGVSTKRFLLGNR